MECVLPCRRGGGDAVAPAGAGGVDPFAGAGDGASVRMVPEAADRPRAGHAGDQRAGDLELQRGDHRRHDHKDPRHRGRYGAEVPGGDREHVPHGGPERPHAGRLPGADLVFRLCSPGCGAVARRTADRAGTHGPGHPFRVHVLRPRHDGAGPLDRQGDLGPHHRAGEYRALREARDGGTGREGCGRSDPDLRGFLRSEEGELGACPGRGSV